MKQTLAFDDAQGQPVLLDTHNEYLAVLTSKALVRVFRLAGREAKPHAGPGERLTLNTLPREMLCCTGHSGCTTRTFCHRISRCLCLALVSAAK